ncbi:hypothetical protein [Actinoplanes sp. RD1]|uniref:hypothetical protein n=1 Tax=Actinoplanes sp. RD1 TaxID=3064538 RepID=UPI0027423C59|nr:hypothetical protein [Actinoplanes sp. RD1]
MNPYPGHYPPQYPPPGPYAATGQPQQVFWNGTGWQQLPPPPQRRGLHAGLLAVLVGLGLGLVLAAGAVATNAYAKHSICTAMESTGTHRSTMTEDDAISTIHDAADRMRGYGRLLLFDRSLKSAIDSLAADMDELATLSGALTGSTASTDSLARFFQVMSAVNTHARDAQRACGLPADGIA